MVVVAEPIRAKQVALEQIELVVAVLRFFAPAHTNVGLATRLASTVISDEAVERAETCGNAQRGSKLSTLDCPQMNW